MAVTGIGIVLTLAVWASVVIFATSIILGRVLGRGVVRYSRRVSPEILRMSARRHGMFDEWVDGP